jgi:hypothetical protein
VRRLDCGWLVFTKTPRDQDCKCGSNFRERIDCLMIDSIFILLVYFQTSNTRSNN